MNTLARQDVFRGARAQTPARIDLLHEVIEGILWLSLDLPEHLPRRDMECLAKQLVARIHAMDSRTRLEQDLAITLLRKFRKEPNFTIIRDVVGRAMQASNGL